METSIKKNILFVISLVVFLGSLMVISNTSHDFSVEDGNSLGTMMLSIIIMFISGFYFSHQSWKAIKSSETSSPVIFKIIIGLVALLLVYVVVNYFLNVREFS